jgi:hypothetical protein
MPRYFFHITHDGSLADDTQGLELPDQTAAWEGATRAWGVLVCEFNDHLAIGTAMQVEVHDQGGPLFRISFRTEVLR